MLLGPGSGGNAWPCKTKWPLIWNFPLWLGFFQIHKDQRSSEAIHHMMEEVHQNQAKTASTNTQKLAVWVIAKIPTTKAQLYLPQLMPMSTLGQLWGEKNARACFLHGSAWYILVETRNRWSLHCNLTYLEDSKNGKPFRPGQPLYERRWALLLWTLKVMSSYDMKIWM